MRKKLISCRVELGGLAGVLIYDDTANSVLSAVVITVKLYLGRDCYNLVEFELCLSGYPLILLARIYALKRSCLYSYSFFVLFRISAEVYRLETKKP